MPKGTINYSTLSQELETIMDSLETDTTDVDAALKAYERGMEIVQQLEDYLKTAENKVKLVKQKFNKQ